MSPVVSGKYKAVKLDAEVRKILKKLRANHRKNCLDRIKTNTSSIMRQHPVRSEYIIYLKVKNIIKNKMDIDKRAKDHGFRCPKYITLNKLGS
jgi:mRNA-degrading endonuclease RelE of RelBE toxin-antitoxin system